VVLFYAVGRRRRCLQSLGLLQCERTSIGNISVNMGEPLLHWRWRLEASMLLNGASGEFETLLDLKRA
jgi:hypothetical protein